MPTDPSSDWIEADRKYVWHPFTQMLTAPSPLPIVHAEGVYLHTVDGRRILDGISSWWVNIHGHNHPRLNDALSRQAQRYAQIIFAGMTHEAGARLAAELVARVPAGLPHVFYSDNGSTAVEVALKMAYQYWRNRGDEKRNLFVALEHAFHGDTIGGMATSARGVFTAAFTDLLFEVRRAAVPFAYREPADEVTEKLPSLEKILEREGDRVAAVIIEPMLQGAGGMIVWPAEFMRSIRDATHQHGIPLIADEVFTGFGRTGKLFACEHGPIVPDLLCLSKGLTAGYLPLAATLATDPIYEAFLNDDRRHTFFHGHSFTGNPLACAVALESLEIFRDEGTLERVRRLETLAHARLGPLRELSVVSDTRVLGGMAAIELTPASNAGYLDSLGPRLSEEFLRRDILLRPLGNVLYVLPPYVITDEEAHHVFDAVESTLR